MTPKSKVILAVVLAGCLGLTFRHLRSDPEAEAIHVVVTKESLAHRVHAAVWNRFPTAVRDHFPAFSPADLVERRIAAIYELGSRQVHSPAAVHALIIALGDPSPWVQQAAIRALEDFGPSATDALDPLLKLGPSLGRQHPFAGSLYATLAAIGPSNPQVLELFISALTNGPTFTDAVSVLEANADHYDESVRQKLLKVQSPDWVGGAPLVSIIGKIRRSSRETTEYLHSFLQHSDLRVRTAAARLLCENVHTEPELIAGLRLLLLEAEDSTSRYSLVQPRNANPLAWHDAAMTAAEALGKAGTNARESIPLLLQVAEQSDVRLRLEAAFAIWKINGDSEKLPGALTDAFARNDVWEHKLALKKLYSLTPSWLDAENFWRQALHIQKNETRHEAIVLLGSLGRRARFALPDLEERLSDPTEFNRTAATTAIAQIKAGDN